MTNRHQIETLAELADTEKDGGFYLWQDPIHLRRFDFDGFPTGTKWHCKIGSDVPFIQLCGSGTTPDEAIIAALKQLS